VLGGGVTADCDVQHIDTTALVRIQMSVKGISLQAAQQAIHRPEFRGVNVLGRLDGAATVSWTRSVSSIRAGIDLSIKDAAPGGTQLSSRDLPVDGTIHASYDGARDTVIFHQTTLRIPSITIALEGNLSSHSNLQVQVAASDLHRVAALASGLRGDTSTAMEIAGSGSLKAVVQGSRRSPLFVGQFNGQNLEVQGSQWSDAKFDFQAKSSEIALHDALLANAHQGKASFNAKVALQNWSYLPSNPVTVNLSVQHMSMADLQRLANLRYPVSGDLSADVSLHGSQLNPVGSGSAKIENARAYGEPIQHLAATFRADKGSASSTLDVSLPAGSASGELSYVQDTKRYTVRLKAPSVALQKLQIVQAKNLGLTGNLTISADGSGTLDNPQLTVALAIPQLQVRNNSISQLKGDLHITDHRAEFAVDSQVAQASVHSSGHIDLAGGYYAEASIDTAGVPLAPLLAMYLPSVPQGFQGETELHASLKGPLKDKSQIEAHLTIPLFKAGYQSLEISSAAPIRADYSRSVITLQPAEIRGTGTSLRVQGSFPLGGATAPSLSAQGTVDVRVLRILEPDIQSSGIVSLDVHASGSAKDPTVRGQVHLQDIGLSSINAPIGVQKLNGTVDISNGTLQLSNVAGEVGGGDLSLGGSISYRPNLRFNLSLQGNSVRLRYPDGLRAVLDGNLAFSGTQDASTLSGRVLIDTLSFTPDFDLAKFSDQFGSSTTPSQPGFADNVRLAVGVQSRGDLNATSSQLSVEGQVNLQLTGSAANPVVIGRTDLTSGELFYRNVRYQLQRGIITFDNPNETEPVMNISATTTVEQYNLTLTMRGPFDKLTTSYTSDPPLATADVINLIARGKTTQEQNAASQSTDSMIASQVASQATGSIQQLAGISSLQIDPLLGGNNQNPSARVAIQQRVTKNFLFTFSTDLSQPGTEIVQGDYQLNKRWSVSLTRDEVGGVSVGGKYHTKF
jgi:translocation and assembly module TamB